MVATIPQSERDPAKIVFTLRQVADQLNTRLGYFHVDLNGSNSSVASSTDSLIHFGHIVADTQSWFDSTTSYRFTPKVGGLWHINLNVGTGSGLNNVPAIYKNGTRVAYGTNYATSTLPNPISTVAILLPMNGTTDFVDARVFSVSSTVLGDSTITYFQGARISP